MGGDRRGGRAEGSGTLTAARVVPDVPSFSVDGGFWYGFDPEDPVTVGSLVRVPLGGRRVRGFVVEVGNPPVESLKPIAGVSGATPIFDPPHLESLRWAAIHYVAPLATLLGRAGPPNLPPRSSVEPTRHAPVDGSVEVWLTPSLPRAAVTDLARETATRGGSFLLVLPTVAEAAAVLETLGSDDWFAGFGTDAELTRAWGALRDGRHPVVGTPRCAAWRLRRPARVVVVEESRRAMKDRQTPTIAVRDLLMHRVHTEGIDVVFVGPTPSIDLVSAHPSVRRAPGRLWPPVEVVDRSREPPGLPLLSETVVRAVRATLRRSGRVFVYAHRRGYAAASRCVACRTTRRCPSCGSRPDHPDRCTRCDRPMGPCTRCGGERFEPLGAGVGRLVEECRRLFGEAGAYPADSRVTVGTERDLVAPDLFELVVLADLDGLVYGSNYRAAEEALRIGARLALKVRQGGRMQVQTSHPSHPVVTALRKGDPTPFHRTELEERRRHGFPPFSQILTLEIRGEGAADQHPRIVEVAGRATVLGPAGEPDRSRWLIQGRDLTGLRVALRDLVQRWRDGGFTVRVDADPLDL
ncbi:MAG: hypothetical protein KatS3mg011_2332 [Acidimicrobiia bacterium]|nr:MAG: hypothetical protein KatS3mg011_2332 [Acidimicrobiia bacterium]